MTFILRQAQDDIYCACFTYALSCLLEISSKLDRLSDMSKKTKAEKIAAALRAQRHALQASSIAEPISSTAQTTNLYTPQAGVTTVKTQHSTQDTDVYEPIDLRITIVITLFVVALLTLVYVFQYKGYF